MMPVAIGCSEFCSRAPARRINSFSSKFFCKGTTFDTSNFPIVNVPVLSNTIVVTLLEFSNAVLFFMSNPF